MRRQKYHAERGEAYHRLFTGKEFYDIIRWGDNIIPDSILRCKSKDFAKQIVFLCRDVKSKYKESVLTSQLLRSGTSIEQIFMRRSMPKVKKTLFQNWK